MKTRALNAVTLLVIWSLSCGCVTKRLWENAEYNEPSTEPCVRLYFSDAKHDVLVTYNELQPTSDAITRRGYYLLENSNRLLKARKPVFVDLQQTNHLKQIPVVVKGTSQSTNAYVGLVAATNATTFELILTNQISGPHGLPVYPSNSHRATQIALTPAALTVDTVIAASVVGLIIWAAHGFDTVH